MSDSSPQADSRPAPQYDVFLSHAGEDAAWCERLAQRLTAAGVRVWFDQWELRPGDHLGARLDHALEHSRRMIAVWSPHYFRQDKLWTLAESYTRHHGDPLVRDRPLIPVLLADCLVKPMFRSLLYVDFRDPADFERRFAELLEALRLPEDESACRSGSRAASAKKEGVVVARFRGSYDPRPEPDDSAYRYPVWSGQ